MRVSLPALAVLALLGCSSDPAGPSSAATGAAASGGSTGAGGLDPLAQLGATGELPLSPGNADGQDEDPSLLVAGGALWAAWYSNRAGKHPDGRERKEIFIARSTDGATWSEPVQVTDSHEWSFYASLAAGADGSVHLAWMRWHLLPAGCEPDPAICAGGPSCCTGVDRRIMYAASSDGLAWDPADAIELTGGPGDELPSLVAASDGRKLVYFASGARGGDAVLRIYVIAHDGTAWGAPLLAAEVSSDADHQTYPHVVERAPGDFMMTFTRYDLAEGGNVFNATTDTMLSTSSDGLTWTAPALLSDGDQDPLVDVFPYLYSDRDRASWRALWVTAPPASTDASVVDLPVTGTFPDDLGALDLPGYTPRVAPTPTPGIYWGAWVAGDAPHQKVMQRFFAK